MKIAAITLCFVLTSCGSFRIFEKDVPSPIRKSEPHKESERQASRMLADRIEKPISAKQLATSLSFSIGQPKEIQTDVSKIKTDLEKHSGNYQSNVDSLNVKLAEFEGKKIEGTGIEIGGIINWGMMIGLILLCVLFPPIVSVLFFLFKRASGTLKNVVGGIDDWAKSNDAESLKEELSKKMDSQHKKLVGKLRHG
jgi:hypothetical protein